MSWKSFFGKKEEKKKRNKQRADDLGITDKELEDLKKKFSQYAGPERSGRLRGNELCSVMKQMGLTVTEEELAHIVTDASGALEFEECLPLVVSKMKAKETEMRDAFRTFDQNGDGVISISELRQAMAKMGQKLSDAEIQAIIRDLDKDGDGFVNYEEFTKFVAGKQ